MLDWRWDFTIDILPRLMVATGNTLMAAAFGYAIAMVLGLVFALVWWVGRHALEPERRPVEVVAQAAGLPIAAQDPLEVVDTVEIGAVHTISVGDLVDPANRLTWRLPMGYQGPAFVVGELFIWGFTGHLIDGLLDLAGWSRPWDPRRMELVPERFLHRAGLDTGQ